MEALGTGFGGEQQFSFHPPPSPASAGRDPGGGAALWLSADGVSWEAELRDFQELPGQESTQRWTSGSAGRDVRVAPQRGRGGSPAVLVVSLRCCSCRCAANWVGGTKTTQLVLPFFVCNADGFLARFTPQNARAGIGAASGRTRRGSKTAAKTHLHPHPDTKIILRPDQLLGRPTRSRRSSRAPTGRTEPRSHGPAAECGAARGYAWQQFALPLDL